MLTKTIKIGETGNPANFSAKFGIKHDARWNVTTLLTFIDIHICVIYQNNILASAISVNTSASVQLKLESPKRRGWLTTVACALITITQIYSRPFKFLFRQLRCSCPLGGYIVKEICSSLQWWIRMAMMCLIRAVFIAYADSARQKWWRHP
jgi:hypothetical protein